MTCRTTTTTVFVATLAAAAIMAGRLSTAARADPVLVFPGMEIRQNSHVCTLGYVDPALRVAVTAGHCHGSGPVTDRDGNVVGNLTVFRDNTPSGSTVTTGQLIADYEELVLTGDVAANNVLPGGRVLASDPRLVVRPGDAVCHFGVITGESCGIVESVNNGWFTMADGVVSQPGDSGGPVYVPANPGSARIVGIFNSVWGEFPAAVSWRSVYQQLHEDRGVISGPGG